MLAISPTVVMVVVVWGGANSRCVHGGAGR
jgi:hypothetical protein